MFILVTYPWPVASAHVELTGPSALHAAATSHHGSADETIEQPARQAEELVDWTDLERLRFHWHLRRMAIASVRRRSPRTSAGLPAVKR
jgi:hypothetical protein